MCFRFVFSYLYFPTCISPNWICPICNIPIYIFRLVSSILHVPNYIPRCVYFFLFICIFCFVFSDLYFPICILICIFQFVFSDLYFPICIFTTCISRCVPFRFVCSTCFCRFVFSDVYCPTCILRCVFFCTYRLVLFRLVLSDLYFLACLFYFSICIFQMCIFLFVFSRRVFSYLYFPICVFPICIFRFVFVRLVFSCVFFDLSFFWTVFVHLCSVL